MEFIYIADFFVTSSLNYHMLISSYQQLSDTLWMPMLPTNVNDKGGVTVMGGGGGGLHNGKGEGSSEVLPLQKGGGGMGEKRFNHAEGGGGKVFRVVFFWGSLKFKPHWRGGGA